MVGAAAGADDAEDFKNTYGVPEAFMKDVGGLIQPGNSAVFAVIRAANPMDIANRFRGYGGTILRTTLAKDTAAKIQDTIRAR
jgi:uncharacterized membrane protein